jgi:putative pyrroloquinoline-quinone binding quinoprotein/fibronectin type III domain protein
VRRRCPAWTLLALACAAAPALADDWTQFGGGAERQGASGERSAPGTGSVWSGGAQGSTRAGPVVSDGVLVTAERGGVVRGYLAASGALLWTQSLGGEGDLTSTPAASRGRAVVALGDGRVACLALATGEVLWTASAGGGPRAAVALSGETLVVSQGFPSRKLRALDLVSGQTRWEQTLGQVAYSSPAIRDGLVVVGTNGGTYEARSLSDGSSVWTYPTTGKVLLSAPALVGDHAYLLPGGADPRLYRVHRDQAQWGTNWTLSLSDPSVPGPGWALMGTQRATATAAWTGQHVVCVVRYDYTRDTVAPWFVADNYISRERIYVVDPTGPSIVWQADLANQSVSRQQDVPALGLCPSPVVLFDGTVTWLGVASSLDATLRYYRADTGAVGPVHNLAGQRWASAASPAAANGRLALTTAAGAVEVLALAGNSAPEAPVNGIADKTFDEEPRPTLTWSASNDAEDAAGTLTYEVRIDDDGEVLLDWDQGTTVGPGVTSWQVGADLISDRDYHFSARARDPQGAYSPWSAPTKLNTALVPAAPPNFRAQADSSEIEFLWDPSPSAGVLSYRVRIRKEGEAFGTPLEVPNTRALFTGLEPTQVYEAEVWATTWLGKESAKATLTVRAQPSIQVNGVAFPDLATALQNATPGSVLQLAQGTFRVNTTSLMAAGVQVRGQGAHRTRIFGNPLFPVIQVGTPQGTVAAPATIPGSSASTSAPATRPPETVLSGVSVHGGRVGIEVHTALTLDHVVIYDVEDGLHVAPGGKVAGDFLTICLAKLRGILVDRGATLALSNSVVTGCGTGLECLPGASVTSNFNAIAGNVVDRKGCVASATDHVGLEPLFNDVKLRDFRVQANSASIDAGDPQREVTHEPLPNGSRVNLGAFGDSNDATSAGPGASSGSSSSSPSYSIGCALSAEPAPWQSALWFLSLLLILAASARRAPEEAPARA